MVRQNTKVGTEWLSGSRVGRKEVGEVLLKTRMLS